MRERDGIATLREKGTGDSSDVDDLAELLEAIEENIALLDGALVLRILHVRAVGVCNSAGA